MEILDELKDVNDWLKVSIPLIPVEIMSSLSMTQAYYARLIEIASQIRNTKDDNLKIFMDQADTGLKQEAYKDLRKSYTAEQDQVLDYLSDLIKVCQMRFEGSRSQLAYLKQEIEQSKYNTEVPF